MGLGSLLAGVFSALHLPEISILAACFFSGIGSVAASICWGWSFVKLNNDRLWLLLCSSFLLSILVTLACSSLPSSLVVGITALLPWASAFCLIRLQRVWKVDRTGDDVWRGKISRGQTFEKSSAKAPRFPLPVVFNIFIFGVAVGFLRGIGVGGSGGIVSTLQEFIMVAIMLGVLIVWTTTRKKSPSIEAIYKVVSFSVVVAFLVFFIDSRHNVVITYSIVMGCYECFWIAIWVAMVDFVRVAGVSSVRIFIVGRGSAAWGLLVGCLAGILLESSDGYGVLFVCVLLVAAMVLLVGQKLPFSIPENESTDAIPAAATTTTIDQFIKTYGLTEREGDVSRYLVQGYNAASIARKLIVSDNTVKTHIKNVYRKTGVSSQQELLDLFRGEGASR